MVIFDLDGTLWDSSPVVAESWNIEIENYTGRKSSLVADDLRRNMGKTMTEIADNLMSEFPVPERYELSHRCEVFENEYIAEHGAELFPKVRETLQQLQDAGHPLIGDPKYGIAAVNKTFLKEYGLEHQLLTAYRLDFSGMADDYPELDGKTFNAKLPKMFEKIEHGFE